MLIPWLQELWLKNNVVAWSTHTLQAGEKWCTRPELNGSWALHLRSSPLSVRVFLSSAHSQTFSAVHNLKETVTLGTGDSFCLSNVHLYPTTVECSWQYLTVRESLLLILMVTLTLILVSCLLARIIAYSCKMRRDRRLTTPTPTA